MSKKIVSIIILISLLLLACGNSTKSTLGIDHMVSNAVGTTETTFFEKFNVDKTKSNYSDKDKGYILPEQVDIEGQKTTSVVVCFENDLWIGTTYEIILDEEYNEDAFALVQKIDQSIKDTYKLQAEEPDFLQECDTFESLVSYYTGKMIPGASNIYHINDDIDIQVQILVSEGVGSKIDIRVMIPVDRTIID